MIKTQGVIDHFVKVFGLGASADEKYVTFSGFDTVGHSAVRRHSVPDLSPVQFDSALFKRSADAVQKMVGQERDENMCIASVLFLMKDRTHDKV